MGKTLALSILLILVASAFSTILPADAQVYRAPHAKPGPASESIRYRAVPLPLAAEALKAGDIDVYIFGVTAPAAKSLAADPRFVNYGSAASILALVFNPAPAPAGELNPFSIREVRFAMHYLVNRDVYINEIFLGQAIPMSAATSISPVDFAFSIVFDIIAKFNFRYDPAFAESLIDQAMTKAGATKVAGKWQFGGKPVVVKPIIRIEDERREIGDMFAADLERLGFTVQREYLPFGPAIAKVYGSDPAPLEWHIYTEGFGRIALNKWDLAGPRVWCSSEGLRSPGWGVKGFWQFKISDEFDQVANKLFRGEFKGRAEYEQLYRWAQEQCIFNNPRVWQVNQISPKTARADLQGVTNDLAAGLRAIALNARNHYIPERCVGGVCSHVTYGNLWVHTPESVWTPYNFGGGGFDDVYSNDIARATSDPPVWIDPFLGSTIPFRARYEVKTAGPDGKLDVPQTAFKWDATKREWVSVGQGVQATSRVTFDLADYFASKWHHGQPISWADVIYYLYMLNDLAFNPDKQKLESGPSTTIRATLVSVVAYNIISDTRLEVYHNFWHFDLDEIAGFHAPMSALALPWEVYFAAETLNHDKGKYAFSRGGATARKLPRLNLVLPGPAGDMAAELAAERDGNVFPANIFTIGGKTYETLANSQARRDAAIKWHKDRGHMWISLGPFFLDRYDAAGQFAEIKAYRDPTYPYRPGAFYFGIAKPIEIKRIGKPTVVPGGEARFLVELEGPGTLSVKYLIFDTLTERILVVAQAEAVTPKRFIITLTPDFTKKLTPGSLYELTVVATSDRVGLVGTAKELFDVLNLAPIETAIESGLKGVSEDLTKRIEGVSKDLASAISTLSNDLKAVDRALGTRLDGVTSRINSVSDRLNSVSDTLSGRIDSASNNLMSQIDDLRAIAATTLQVAQIVLVLALIAIALSALAMRRK